MLHLLQNQLVLKTFVHKNIHHQRFDSKFPPYFKSVSPSAEQLQSEEGCSFDASALD
jgi:hypothetical protein